MGNFISPRPGDHFERVHPLAIYHWLQESVFEASAEAGWPHSRLLEAGFVILQTRTIRLFWRSQEPGTQSV